MSKINRKKRIENKLIKTFNPTLLEVRDDSHMHAGHTSISKGENETHYFIKMNSKIFSNLTKIRMHQEVYRTLDDEFKTGLHALELDLKSS